MIVMMCRKPSCLVEFWRAFRGDTTAAAAVEFAIIAPLLIMVAAGILVWGGWFWMAHSVQQLANDGARAAIAGLNAEERRALATASIHDNAGEMLGGRADRLSINVTENTDRLRVEVVYDASDVVPDLSRVVATPDPRIARSANVRLAGF